MKHLAWLRQMPDTAVVVVPLLHAAVPGPSHDEPRDRVRVRVRVSARLRVLATFPVTVRVTVGIELG